MVLIKKAAITTTSLASGGILNAAQFNSLLNLVTNYSRFLGVIRTEVVDNASGQIDRIDIGSPVTVKATEATETTDTRSPDFSKVSYSVVKTSSAFDISSESEEDNIERAGFRRTLVNAFTDRISMDMTQLAIQGDDSLSATTDLNKLLMAYDGLHIQTVTASNFLDANGLGVSLKLFKDALAKFPVRYKGRLRKNLRWFIASNPMEDFVYEYGSRATSGGDTVYNSNPDLRPFGIPFEECPLIPINQTIGTAATDGTFIVLTDPKNLIWVVRRKMAMYFEFKGRQDLTQVTVYMRTAFIIENKDALVKVRSISADAATAYGA